MKTVVKVYHENAEPEREIFLKLVPSGDGAVFLNEVDEKGNHVSMILSVDKGGILMSPGYLGGLPRGIDRIVTVRK